MITSQDERNFTLNYILQTDFFDKFRHNHNGQLELFIRGVCSNNCQYCYLKQHGKELYPIESQSEEQILKNIRLIAEWYVENKFTVNLSLFSGEIIISGLLFKILDIFLEIFGKEFNIYKPDSIIFPDDGLFLEYPEIIDKVDKYIESFHKINIDFIFSLSLDGKYMDSNRDHKHDDNFYARAFDFAERHLFSFHPMIAANNIENWIENYDWWHSNEVPQHLVFRLTTLEVRNDDWTIEKINSYLALLNHIIDYEFNMLNKDKLLFSQRILHKESTPLPGYDILSILPKINSLNKDTLGMNCSIGADLCLRVGDLTIIPCHRLGYKQFEIGTFNVINNKITDITCKNYEIYTGIKTWNRTVAPKCANCAINSWCISGCMGSNYESTHDVFMPPERVCNLFKAKFGFLMIKYEEMGLIPYFKELLSDYQFKQITTFMEQLQGRFQNYGNILANKIGNARRNGETANDVTL